MDTLQALQKIYKVNCKTIQETTHLECLNNIQQIRINCIVNKISYSLNVRSSSRVTVVFRGDNFNNLSEKLSCVCDIIDETEMFRLLFYFGDKAKHYYKYNNEEIEKSRWIRNIEDVSIESGRVIFRKIRKVLSSSNEQIIKFRTANQEFVDYFEVNNIDRFSEILSKNNKLRDYYLYFLHTAGKIGVGDKSLLVSTSRRYDVAKRFAGTQQKKYIIYYVIPPPVNNYAIAHSFRDFHCALRRLYGLPGYKGTALYPEQHEVAIKGALFSHHMLGVMVETDYESDFFVPNPHLFSPENNEDAILKGLKFDQSNFENNLRETGYFRGVGVSLDGHYSTI